MIEVCRYVGRVAVWLSLVLFVASFITSCSGRDSEEDPDSPNGTVSAEEDPDSPNGTVSAEVTAVGYEVVRGRIPEGAPPWQLW
jgi:hypothetical protein